MHYWITRQEKGRWGEVLAFISGGVHLVICPPRFFYTPTRHSCQEGLGVCMCLCMGMNVHKDAHAPCNLCVQHSRWCLLLCGVLINPMMTEWLQQVTPFWVSWWWGGRNTIIWVNAKASQCKFSGGHHRTVALCWVSRKISFRLTSHLVQLNCFFKWIRTIR